MEWTMEYLENDSIVYVKLLSPANIERTKQMCLEMDQMAREHNTHKYLIDHRGIGVIMSVMDIDKVPGMLKEIEADFEGKIVLLLDSHEPKRNLFKFLKNVLRLVSMRVELFYDDKEKAIDWLKAN